MSKDKFFYIICPDSNRNVYHLGRRQSDGLIVSFCANVLTFEHIKLGELYKSGGRQCAIVESVGNRRLCKMCERKMKKEAI